MPQSQPPTSRRDTGSCPAAPLPLWFPPCGLEKQPEWPKALGPLAPARESQRLLVPAFGSALPIAGTWEVTQQMEDLTLILSVNLTFP